MGTVRIQKESEEAAAQQRLESDIDKARNLIQQEQGEVERLQEEVMAEHHDQTEIARQADRHEHSIQGRRDPDQGRIDQ